jgi:hypothetical protein
VDAQDLRNAQWHISTYSANGSTCVEVATNLADAVAIRDSKNRQGPVLVVATDEWAKFCTGVKQGEFGLA